MSLKPSVTTIGITIAIATIGVGTAIACPIPQNFTSCINPSGQVIADHHEPGDMHSIAGKDGQFPGTDIVYKNDDAITQCFCPPQGMGIQTKWMKADQHSEEEIKDFLSQGWILIDNGADWGLDQGKYLAQNSDFVCHAEISNVSVSPTPQESPTPTPEENFSEVTPTPTQASAVIEAAQEENTTTNSQASSNTNSGSSTTASPSTNSPAPEVAQLANTGSVTDIFFMIAAGVVSLSSGLMLRRVNK